MPDPLSMNAMALIELGALMRLQLLGALEAHVDPGCPCFHGVIDDLARRCGGVAVAATSLRLQCLGGVEERERIVVGKAVEVFLLALDLGQQTVARRLKVGNGAAHRFSPGSRRMAAGDTPL